MTNLETIFYEREAIHNALKKYELMMIKFWGSELIYELPALRLSGRVNEYKNKLKNKKSKLIVQEMLSLLDELETLYAIEDNSYKENSAA